MFNNNRKDKLQIIGLMSGTSLDGLDIACVQFDYSTEEIHYDLSHCETVPYDDVILSKLKNYLFLSVPEMLILDKEIGRFYGEKVNDFIVKFSIQKNSLDAIACHGQTIFHQPENGFTYQIGCGSTLAFTTGINVINDFRTRDVVAGGQGAPLVPIGDFNLFNGKAESFLNIGGFTNISFSKNNNIIAFDICPGNLPLNSLSLQLGKEYDANGNFARCGNVDSELLEKFNNLAYYSQESPKSLGTEWIESHFQPLILAKNNVFDLLRTVTEHIAIQVANILKSEKLKSVFITGGGAKNTFLIERLKYHFSGEIIIPDTKTIDFKEALVFAFLGARYQRNETTTLASVTGAKKEVCSGVLHIPGY